MKIESESYHENISGFFKEVNDWLAGYFSSGFDALTFDCKMEYFNSSTAELLLNMLIDMDGQASSDKKIIINLDCNKR